MTDIPLWIVPMDRRTLYDCKETAEAMARSASFQLRGRWAFAVLWTGAAYAVSAKHDLDPVNGWLFDGSFCRSDPVARIADQVREALAATGGRSFQTAADGASDNTLHALYKAIKQIA